MFLRQKYSKKSAHRGRRQSSLSSNLDYQNLEARQLLAVEVGVNFTGATYLTDSSAITPNANGDISETHTVEVVNGRYSAYNRFTGNRVETMTLDTFFLSAGGSIFSTLENPRVVYDQTSDRFFVAAIGGGEGNWIHVAFSNTSDPTDGWQTLQFAADSTGLHFNDDLTLAVDADAVYFATNNVSDVVPDDSSIYSIPKVDMFLPDPTLTNMSRFEGLDPAIYGTTIQVASNFEASDGRAIALGSLDFANVAMTDINGPGAPAATLGIPTEIELDFGDGHDDYVPQIPHDEYIDQIEEVYRAADQPFQDSNFGLGIFNELGLTGNVVEVNGSVWGAQTVSLVGVPFYSAINWFKIDLETRQVDGSTPIAPEYDGNLYQNTRIAALQDPYVVGLRGPASHLIRPEPLIVPPDPFDYLFNPSIAVTAEGLVAISYNRITPDQPISVGVVAGTYVTGSRRGNVQLEPLFEVQNGFEMYNLNTLGQDPWGSYGSIKVDPVGYNNFFMTMPWANTTDRWSVQNTQFSLVDMNPIIEADRGNNEIVIRRNAVDTNLVEVEIDGVVTDTFAFDALGRVEIWASDGSDSLLIDYTNGDPTPAGGFLFDGGAGPDVVETNNPDGSEFVMTQPNHPTFGNNYPAYLSSYRTRFGDDGSVSDGFYNETSELVDIEELRGGPGPDTFTFRGNWTMGGSANGQGGDDTFKFIDEPFPFSPFNPPFFSGVEENIIGGEGYDTIDFEGRLKFTKIELIGFGASGGFDGRVNGEPNEILPIGGGIFQPDDVFREIEHALGSSMQFEDSLTFQDDLQGTWTIDDENSSYVTQDDNGADRQFDFYQWNVVNASIFDDTFNVLSNTVNTLALNGLEGNDVYTFNSAAPALTGTSENIKDVIIANAGPGVNQIFASNIGGSAVDALILAARVRGLGEFAYTAIGGTVDMEVWGSEFDDNLALHSFLPDNTLVVRSFDGDDTFSIQDLSRASVMVYGGDGDDDYIIERIQGVSFRNLEIIDSIDAETDRVLLAGTVLDETFTITSDTFVDLDFDVIGIEVYGIEGRGGNDTFNVLDYDGDIFLDGGLGNDVFNFSSDGANLQGDLAGFLNTDITIEGGLGTNQIFVSNFAGAFAMDVTVRNNELTGLWAGSLFFQSTGGTFSRTGDIGGVTIRGTDLNPDLFDIQTLLMDDSVAIEGAGGNDSFYARSGALGDVRFNGGDGNDNHHVFFGGADGRVVQIIDDSAPSKNRLNFYGTALDDVISVSPAGVLFDTESATLLGDFALLNVFGFAGEDQLNLDGTRALTNLLHGGDDNDTVNVDSSVGANGLRVVLGQGDDNFNFWSTDENTFTRALGGDGDDTFTITAGVEGTMIADGQEGSDRYNVNFSATRQRFVDTRDTGTGDMDITAITGTVIADEVEIRANRVIRINEIAALGNETVAYGSENEVVIVNTIGGPDLVSMFASISTTTRLQTGEGDDTINVRSTAGSDQVTLDAGEGNDLINVYKVFVGTNVGIFGRGGDDTFVVGSNAVVDNGNLGFIRGRVALYGGDNVFGSQDTLYINDRLANAPYAYSVNGTGVRAIDGPLGIPRTAFQGIIYDDTMEFVRLDTTDLSNYISVTPSQSTKFYIDGNQPSTVNNSDFINLLSTDAGRELHITDSSNGEGFWDFTDGSLDVAFEGIEDTSDGVI